MSGLVESWAHLYDNNRIVNIAVTFTHFAGVFVGGGLALAADRVAFRSAPEVVDHTVHRWVVAALAAVFVSGTLMLLADLDTFLTSAAFWIKMVLIVLLLANGYARIRAEAKGQPLRRTAAISAALWIVVLLAGTILSS